MAEKFGNFRWVKEGYLDNRWNGIVVGRVIFAAIGDVDFCLQGDCKGEIFGKVFRFRNSQYLDDEWAFERLSGFAIPQVGHVSLISFDPHPLLPPHPYIEWFSEGNSHYRIELEPEDAWILPEKESEELTSQSESIRDLLASRFGSEKSKLIDRDYF